MSPLLVFGRGVNSISFNQRPMVLRDFVGTCCTTPATFVNSGLYKCQRSVIQIQCVLFRGMNGGAL